MAWANRENSCTHSIVSTARFFDYMAFSTIVSCCRHQSIVITISTSTIRQLFFVLFSFDQNISCSCVNQIFVFDFSCYCCCCCLFLPKRNNLAVRLWFCFSCFSSVCRPLNCFFSSPGAFHLWLDIDCVKYKVFVRRQTGTKCEYEKVSELLFMVVQLISLETCEAIEKLAVARQNQK